jgi:hypothetical protein
LNRVKRDSQKKELQVLPEIEWGLVKARGYWRQRPCGKRVGINAVFEFGMRPASTT